MYLFSFNFVALSFVLPHLEQVSVSFLIKFAYNLSAQNLYILVFKATY